MTRLIKLTFDNRTAGQSVELQVAPGAAKFIAEWYGAYYAGDDYDVLINGRPQALGINGELEPTTITVQTVQMKEIS